MVYKRSSPEEVSLRCSRAYIDKDALTYDQIKSMGMKKVRAYEKEKEKSRKKKKI